MPRVENLGPNVDDWYKNHNPDGAGTSTHDVCKNCHDDLKDDPHCADDELKPYHTNEPQGTDGWGGDVEHPPYEDDFYSCAVCGEQLTDNDD